ncbi:hypothetical protein QOZ80_2AG0139180 [Eleusine coracana subsp. coracana]|nr:hypothetical protein QOZ80_2AG0139180 [Eleusine coracana subsp. coracana]
MASGSARRVLLLALLPLLLLAPRSSSAPTTTFPGDAAALASLKSSSIPPQSCLATWDFARRDPCAAFPCGLRCVAPPNSTHLRVAGVALDPAGYSGAFPTRLLASLPYLTTLSLAGNRFHGPLPDGVPLPPTLRVLDLSSNAFTGPIPGSLFTRASELQELYLSRNAFSGVVPPQLASLASLTRLELQHNALAGSPSLPPGMRALAHLDLTANKLSGPPPLDALPPSLVSFVARDNAFSGAVPAAPLAALGSIRVLDLTGNALSGAVPGAALAHPSLQQLRLGSNQLDAVAAPNGGGCASSQLAELDLSNNRIAGRLPACLGSMPRLVAVALDRNRFTGPVPDAYAARVAAQEATDEWVPFARLMLQGNFLCGALPGRWTQLREDDGAKLSVADNCLPRCPRKFFFCQGAPQKNQAACPTKCDAAAIRHVREHEDLLLEMP